MKKKIFSSSIILASIALLSFTPMESQAGCETKPGGTGHCRQESNGGTAMLCYLFGEGSACSGSSVQQQ